MYTVNAASADSVQKVLLIQVKTCLNERSIQVEMHTCCVPKISHTASGTVIPSMLILERLPFHSGFHTYRRLSLYSKQRRSVA
jgi:hypothetical protein